MARHRAYGTTVRRPLRFSAVLICQSQPGAPRSVTTARSFTPSAPGPSRCVDRVSVTTEDRCIRQTATGIKSCPHVKASGRLLDNFVGIRFRMGRARLRSDNDDEHQREEDRSVHGDPLPSRLTMTEKRPGDAATLRMRGSSIPCCRADRDYPTRCAPTV